MTRKLILFLLINMTLAGLSGQTPADLTSSRWAIIDAEGEVKGRHENGFVEYKGKFYLIGGRGINPVNVFDSATHIMESSADAQTGTFSNPVLPGFYPDPSLCRVDDTYYMVTSTFEWFPGIPVHRSKDLVNWEPIGHVIDRKGMICEDLNIWAPTIRYHEGLFYVICTEKPGYIFYVTASDPAGPWSDPVYIHVDPDTVSAIDPSLFWDDDGTCWLAANDRIKSGTIKHWVWIQEVDLTPVEKHNRKEATLKGERRYITEGSGIGPDNYTEAPHIYKYNGHYYLVIAEGGTWDKHAVSFLRTTDLRGAVEKWEYHPGNPVLTHRDKESAISATGHADLIETQNGEWWALHLGVRKQDGKHKLGRETFLVPVQWQKYDDGKYWPLFNPEKGNMTLMEDRRPDLPWTPVAGWPGRDEFTGSSLRPEWNFYMEPVSFDWFRVENGELTMNLLPRRATDRGKFAFIARRQQHHNFDVSAKMIFKPEKENEVAGIMAAIKHTNNIRLEISISEGSTTARVFYVTSDGEKITGETVLPGSGATYFIKLEARGWNFQFYAGTAENDLIPVGGIQDATILSSEIAKGFTGSFVGMYCSSNGENSSSKASFEWFGYKGK
jgi:xylan 1,4-beta-xylosidase